MPVYAQAVIHLEYECLSLASDLASGDREIQQNLGAQLNQQLMCPQYEKEKKPKTLTLPELHS